jgi:cytochrome c2
MRVVRLRTAKTMVAKVCRAIAFGTGSLVALASSSLAQPGLSDPQRGHELAARLCTNCHVIDRHASGPMRYIISLKRNP